ncbi:hypothetical protein BC940DRAFT_287173 [Gongronella butleri]|nr:hypothetical protein BC940DRAFT_287173 [Gongronella butleri]
MVVADTSNTIPGDNEPADIDPAFDVVEDFARQLDELCATTAQLDTYSDDDADDDAQVPFGYEQLPQDGDDGTSSDDNDDNDDQESQENTNMMESPLNASNAEPLELRVDPNDNIPQPTSDLILGIMKNITLPDHAIPDWAKSIPESSWMPVLKPKNDDNVNGKE